MQIRSLQPLSSLTGLHLEELYCAENKIAKIECISHLTSLTQLELGSNRIKVRIGPVQRLYTCTHQVQSVACPSDTTICMLALRVKHNTSTSKHLDHITPGESKAST